MRHSDRQTDSKSRWFGGRKNDTLAEDSSLLISSIVLLTCPPENFLVLYKEMKVWSLKGQLETHTFVSFCLASRSALSLSIAFFSETAFSSASNCNIEEKTHKQSLSQIRWKTTKDSCLISKSVVVTLNGNPAERYSEVLSRAQSFVLWKESLVASGLCSSEFGPPSS